MTTLDIFEGNTPYLALECTSTSWGHPYHRCADREVGSCHRRRAQPSTYCAHRCDAWVGCHQQVLFQNGRLYHVPHGAMYVFFGSFGYQSLTSSCLSSATPSIQEGLFSPPEVAGKLGDHCIGDHRRAVVVSLQAGVNTGTWCPPVAGLIDVFSKSTTSW